MRIVQKKIYTFENRDPSKRNTHLDSTMSQVPSVDARVDARSPAPLHGRPSFWACMSSTPWGVARLSRQKEGCNVVRVGDRMIQIMRRGQTIVWNCNMNVLRPFCMK